MIDVHISTNNVHYYLKLLFENAKAPHKFLIIVWRHLLNLRLRVVGSRLASWRLLAGVALFVPALTILTVFKTAKVNLPLYTHSTTTNFNNQLHFCCRRRNRKKVKGEYLFSTIKSEGILTVWC